MGVQVALIGLIGVVVGGVIALLSSFLQVLRSAKSERVQNLLETRRDAYIAYAEIVKEEARLARRVAAFHGVVGSRIPISPEVGRGLAREISERRSRALEGLLLVGTTSVVECARIWHHAVWKAENYVIESSEINAADFESLFARSGKAREEFYHQARKDLLVRGKVSALSDEQLEKRWAQL